jgi:undecaprenyl-diphosphatase
MFSFLHSFDLALLYKINGWTSPALDWLMLVVSAPKFFLWPGIVAGLLLAWKGGFRGRVFLVLVGLSVLVGDGLIDNYGKRWVHRPRPNEALEGIRVFDGQGVSWAYPHTEPGGRSFPSGHVFNNVSLALLACAVYGARRFWWVWLWAALVGYSRIYLGAHYPSDVAGSLAIAVAYNLALLALARAAWRRYAPVACPALAVAFPELTWRQARRSARCQGAKSN